MKHPTEKSLRTLPAGSAGHGPGGQLTVPADEFDIRLLIRSCIRDSARSSDPVTIAECVAERIPEDRLREIVAQWLPRQVGREMANMYAERIARGR
jgi:hypothetical protein